MRMIKMFLTTCCCLVFLYSAMGQATKKYIYEDGKKYLLFLNEDEDGLSLHIQLDSKNYPDLKPFMYFSANEFESLHACLTEAKSFFKKLEKEEDNVKQESWMSPGCNFKKRIAYFSADTQTPNPAIGNIEKLSDAEFFVSTNYSQGAISLETVDVPNTFEYKTGMDNVKLSLSPNNLNVLLGLLSSEVLE